MIDDRNKTALTKGVTSAVYRYLDDRGFKPLETEVPVCDGWVADLAGILNPTITELQELKLIPRKPKWNSPDIEAWYQLAKQRHILMTALVEVKTSMSDFRGDKKWTAPCPANLAYLAIPKSLPLESAQFPERWGVLEYDEARAMVRIVKPPDVWTVSVEQQLSLVLDVAVRRDHHTRYARLRELQKQQRARENEDISRTRAINAMCAMTSIVQGKYESVENCLQYHGIKHLPKHFMDQLQRLWGVAPQP